MPATAPPEMVVGHEETVRGVRVSMGACKECE